MSLKHTMIALDLLDDSRIDGKQVIDLFKSYEFVEAMTETVHGEEGSTDFIKVIVQGTAGKTSGGNSKTLGIVGRLGGIGARPERIGLVSDADGAVSAVGAALKLADMAKKGDRLEGDVIITTHICPNAPTVPHEPVDFMGSPVDIFTMNQYEVLPEMDAIVSIDTTKGNELINHRGIALSATVKEGYILKYSNDLLRILSVTTGEYPVTFPISTQDITPYGNGVYHINSILQPAVATDAPVVGLAITTKSVVPGCGTGASHETDIAAAIRFSIEVAKEFTDGTTSFYDEVEFEKLNELYGSMRVLQTMGRK